MSSKIKIRVGVPSYSGKLFPESYETIKALSAYSGPVEFDPYIVPQCNSTADGRNKGVSLSDMHVKQTFDYDYYLSMDADNSFNVSDVLMLLDRRLDIVSAAYPMRSSKLGCTLNRYVAANWKPGFPGIAYQEQYFLIGETKGLVRADTVGMGCCLIKREVFEAMEYPYFRSHIIPETIKGEKYAYLAADDVSFCLDAANYGFSIYLDADVVIQHNAGNEER